MKTKFFNALIFLAILIFGITMGKKVYAEENEQEQVYSELYVQGLPRFKNLPSIYFVRWLKKEVPLTEEIREMKGLDTTINISFVVKKDGTTSNINISGSPTKEYADQLTSKIANTEGWVSGKVDDKPVHTFVELTYRIKVGYRSTTMSDTTKTVSPSDVEVMPMFRDGDINTFRNWVMRNVKYPQEAIELGLKGRVIARFVIEKDGSLDQIEISKSPAVILSDEVEAVLISSPLWTPGMRHSQPVRVQYEMPVDFNSGY